MFDAKAFLSTTTSRPGVYRMFDAKGSLLYVGKAKNLKNRLSSYFNKQHDARLQALVSQIASIEVTVTNNEKEALLLENEQIKSLNPRYNIVLKDDKSYPYLFLSKHEYPRLVFHRGPQKKKGEYFGPYPSAYAVKDTLNLLQRLFKLRQCDDTFFNNRSRPCLQYQIERCSAPCTRYISEDNYKKDVQHSKMFLKGQHQHILDELIAGMGESSKELDFERAAVYRDQIQNIQKIIEQQAVYGKEGDLDVVAMAHSGEQVVVTILFIRSGKMSGSKNFYPKQSKALDVESMLESFLSQYYLATHVAHSHPKEIVLSHGIAEPDSFVDMMAQIHQKKVKLSFQVRGQKKRWQQLAIDNASIALKQRLGSHKVYFKRMQALQEALGLSGIERIECFDISHTMGEETVGSCVVFDDKGPAKAMYRQYNIENGGGDDYAAMEQVLTRRYQKMKSQNQTMPDLVLIDGGKGQLNIARKVLKECQIVDVLLVGVAKGEGRKPGLETLYAVSGDNGEELKVITLMPTSEALHLVQQIRDEAHRFAIKRHRAKRSKKRNTSVLEQIPGVGPKRRQQLITHFGGQKGLMAASEEAISNVTGISKALAKVIYQHLHES